MTSTTKFQWIDCQQPCCNKSFEKNFEINRYFFTKCFISSRNFNKWILCSPNYKISLIWLRELYLWNNLCVIFMSFIDGSLTIIRWKERTFINIFLNEWITYILWTLNFQNTFSMAFAIHNTVRRGSNVSPILCRNKPAFSNLNSMCFTPSFVWNAFKVLPLLSRPHFTSSRFFYLSSGNIILQTSGVVLGCVRPQALDIVLTLE